MDRKKERNISKRTMKLLFQQQLLESTPIFRSTIFNIWRNKSLSLLPNELKHKVSMHRKWNTKQKNIIIRKKKKKKKTVNRSNSIKLRLQWRTIFECLHCLDIEDSNLSKEHSLNSLSSMVALMNCQNNWPIDVRNSVVHLRWQPSRCCRRAIRHSHRCSSQHQR